MPRYVQVVSWGEDYTVQVVHGLGDLADFEVSIVGVGDLAHVVGHVDKVRIVDGWGERPRYRVRVV